MASTWGQSWGTSWGVSWGRESPQPAVSIGGGWPPLKVGYKKGRRQAKRIIDEIREAIAALEYTPNVEVKAEAIQAEIVQAVQIVDRYPELLQQLMHIKQQLDAYLRSIDDDDDEFFLLM